MPTYQYACTDCADRVEAVQKFTDEPLSACVSCGGRLRKVFTPVGIVFKGSGFYRTDSRPGHKEKAVEPAAVAANGSDGKKPAAAASAGSSAGSSGSSGDKAGKSEKKAGQTVSSGSGSSSGSASPSGSKVA